MALGIISEIYIFLPNGSTFPDYKIKKTLMATKNIYSNILQLKDVALQYKHMRVMWLSIGQLKDV